MERLAKGVALWEKPLSLHVVTTTGAPSKTSANKWTIWQVSKPILSRIHKALPNNPEPLDEGLFLVISEGGSICAITLSTKEGGIEAFHKSMRLLMDKNERDG